MPGPDTTTRPNEAEGCVPGDGRVRPTSATRDQDAPVPASARKLSTVSALIAWTASISPRRGAARTPRGRLRAARAGSTRRSRRWRRAPRASCAGARARRRAWKITTRRPDTSASSGQASSDSLSEPRGRCITRAKPEFRRLRRRGLADAGDGHRCRPRARSAGGATPCSAALALTKMARWADGSEASARRGSPGKDRRERYPGPGRREPGRPSTRVRPRWPRTRARAAREHHAQARQRPAAVIVMAARGGTALRARPGQDSLPQRPAQAGGIGGRPLDALPTSREPSGRPRKPSRTREAPVTIACPPSGTSQLPSTTRPRARSASAAASAAGLRRARGARPRPRGRQGTRWRARPARWRAARATGEGAPGWRRRNRAASAPRRPG